MPFTDGVGTYPNVPIVTADLAYDYAITGKTLVLIIHNALYIENMNQNLVLPIMLLLYGIQVNECPKFLSMNPSESYHSILFPNNLSIPVSLHGSISYIPSRRPTMVEYNNLLSIKLNSEYPIWGPYFSSFASQESNMVKHDGSIISIPSAKRAVHSLMQTIQEEITTIPSLQDSQTSSVLHEISPALNARKLFFKSMSHSCSS